MNIVTYQLMPLAGLLTSEPIAKEDFIKKARQALTKDSLLDFLEMIEFEEIHKKGNEIVLK